MICNLKTAKYKTRRGSLACDTQQFLKFVFSRLSLYSFVLAHEGNINCLYPVNQPPTNKASFSTQTKMMFDDKENVDTQREGDYQSVLKKEGSAK